MRKSLATLLLAAVPALALSACNTASSGITPATSPNGGGSAAAYARAHHGKHHPHDFSASDLHGGGATFPGYAYNLAQQPTGGATTSGGGPSPQAPPGTGSLFDAAPTNGTIYYCLTGSGYGRSTFEGYSSGASTIGQATNACAPLGATATGFGGRVDPPDFAGSDVAMSSSDYSNYVTGREGGTSGNTAAGALGEPFQFPVIGGPIVQGFRAKDFPQTTASTPVPIKLSLWSLCALTNGTITNWNDSAITQDNGGTPVTKNGASEPITYYFRSDNSGTTYNFLTFIQNVCTASWPAPYNKFPYQSSERTAAWTYAAVQPKGTWTGPGSTGFSNPEFVGENGNPGVLAAIQDTPFGTGYVEGAYAASANPKVGQAWIQAVKNYAKSGPHGSEGKGVVVYANPVSKAAIAQAFNNIGVNSVQTGQGSDSNPLAGDTAPWCAMSIPPSTLDARNLTKQYQSYPIVAVSYLLFYGNNSAGSNASHTSDQKAMINFLESSSTASGSAEAIESNLEYQALPSGIRANIVKALNGTGGHAACLK